MSLPITPLTLWLVFMAILLVGLTLLGGAVRLTDSGLSITQWRPLLGAIPPLSSQNWNEAFEAYKQIPQYRMHPDIMLAEFQTIYWWEWAHRFLARFVGIAFAVPFLFFLWRGSLNPSQRAQCIIIFCLGALQGLVGWYMVSSGLSERVSVAPLKLAFHLGLAMIIYGWVVWLIIEPVRKFSYSPLTLTLSALVFFQLLLGAMVSGLDGGMINNDFLWGAASPLKSNLTPVFDNPSFWQLLHRLNGWILLITSFFAWYHLHRTAAVVLSLFLVFQVILGISTLLLITPLSLALLHQFGGVMCWTAALLLLTKNRSLYTL